MRKLPGLSAPPRAVAETRDHGRDLLRNLAAGGASSLVKALLQLAMLPVMGRLLGPHEFGLYATVLPIVTFFAVIADGGLGASLAKEKSADRTVWNTAFYAMLALGVCLVGLVNLCGLALANFMHEPKLLGLMALLSVTFLFIAAATLPAARLIQRNDLVSLAAVDTLATFVGAAVALFGAWHGLGAMSLAVQMVTAFAVRAIGFNALAFERPGRSVSLAALSTHLNTGGVLVGSRLADMFCRFAENVLFSIAFGPAALGLYTFANQVCRFLCESASNPVWSATYAQALKLGGRALNELICNMSRLMLIAIFPAACLVAIAAPDVFPLLLGSKWQHAGLFLQILVCAHALAATATVPGAALLATGENKLFLATAALLPVGRVLAVGCGHWLGAVQVVGMIALLNLCYAAVTLTLIARTCRIDMRRLMAAVATPLASGAAAAVVCLAVLRLAPPSPATTGSALALGGLVFMATLTAIDRDFSVANVRRSVGRVLARGA